jgi:hypothetical protein
MWVNRRFTASLSLVAFASFLFAQSSLDAGFVNPPNSAKPHTWWHWINGNISKAGITADLEAMKKIGIGGAQIFNVEVGIPIGKTPMMTPQWQEAMAWAFKEAKRLNIEICVHNCGGWSSSGGPWVKPEDAMQLLTWSETTVKGPKRFEGILPKPEAKLNYYRDIAVYAVRKPANGGYRNPDIRTKAGFDRGDKIAPQSTTIPTNAVTAKEDVIDLKIDANGKVAWNVPDGEWTLIRMGHTPTGAENSPSPDAGRGPEVDKMSRTAMDHFWDGMMASVLKDNGKIEKYGLNNALIDSYEVGSQNWTPKFREEFMKRRGYDPMPFLPAITGRIVQSGEVTERFLWDWRRTICDLFADNYFAYFKELCHKNGLQFSVEGYGNGSFDNLQVSGLGDIPMGEFWVPNGMAQESTKLAASAAHTNGKPIIGAEAFTADENQGRWLVDPYSAKALGDRIFTMGINRYIFHRYAHQPWLNLEPGMTMGPWGMNLDRTITWWDQGQAWMKYITRSQFLLQSGRFVADVVAFTGEEGPNDLPMMKGKEIPEGYDYDGCDATVLHQMKVENGQIVLPTGMRYRVLMLPQSKFMTIKTVRKIAQLVNDGATVVGPAPEKSPSLSEYPHGDQEVQRTAAKVWNMASARQAHSGKTVKQVLAEKQIGPDLTATRPVNWIHRVDKGTDIYFVANPAYRPIDLDVSFRIGDRQPELWNPETGKIENAPVWHSNKGRTTVSMRMESAGSTFVIFRKAPVKKHLTSLVWLGESEKEPKLPKVEIISARYQATDGSGGIDVTEKAKELISHGESSLEATNSNFGDPTVNRVKHLFVVYTIDGKRFEQKINENGSLEFMPQLPDNAIPNFLLVDGKVQPWRTGKIKFAVSDGTSGIMESKPTNVVFNVPWTVSFPPKKGAPASIVLDKLISWSDSNVNGVKFFSGTAKYETNFVFSPTTESTWLDLGKVKNFAEVELNGHKFDTLWKSPFRLDVSRYLKVGKNSLVVRVTNLWPNRLIGDEQYPPDAKYNGGPITEWPQWILDGKPRPASNRIGFATWKFYSKDSPLLDSGLIGPVRLVSVKSIDPSKLRTRSKK